MKSLILLILFLACAYGHIIMDKELNTYLVIETNIYCNKTTLDISSYDQNILNKWINTIEYDFDKCFNTSKLISYSEIINNPLENVYLYLQVNDICINKVTENLLIISNDCRFKSLFTFE